MVDVCGGGCRPGQTSGICSSPDAALGGAKGCCLDISDTHHVSRFGHKDGGPKTNHSCPGNSNPSVPLLSNRGHCRGCSAGDARDTRRHTPTETPHSAVKCNAQGVISARRTQEEEPVAVLIWEIRSWTPRFRETISSCKYTRKQEKRLSWSRRCGAASARRKERGARGGATRGKGEVCGASTAPHECATKQTHGMVHVRRFLPRVVALPSTSAQRSPRIFSFAPAVRRATL